ncbi:MAG: hypothetical protein EAS48_00950 [Chryseobacterium sp.]|nr:MAG: hypothetical protein EAS48_00950 [Chryseobacterium sp.]
MKMDPKEYEQLFSKFFSGDTGLEEEKQLKNHKEHGAQAYFEALHTEKNERMDWSFDEMMQQTPSPLSIVKPKKRAPIKPLFWLAASVAIIFGSYFLMSENHRPRETTQQVVKTYSKTITSPTVPEQIAEIPEPIATERIASVETAVAKTVKQSEEPSTEIYRADTAEKTTVEDENYVVVNGKKIYDEETALLYTEAALRLLSENLNQTVAYAAPIEKMSVTIK